MGTPPLVTRKNTQIITNGRIGPTQSYKLALLTVITQVYSTSTIGLFSTPSQDTITRKDHRKEMNRNVIWYALKQTPKLTKRQNMDQIHTLRTSKTISAIVAHGIAPLARCYRASSTTKMVTRQIICREMVIRTCRLTREKINTQTTRRYRVQSYRPTQNRFCQRDPYLRARPVDTLGTRKKASTLV